MKAKFTFGGILVIAGFLLVLTGHLGLTLIGSALAVGGAYLMNGFKEA